MSIGERLKKIRGRETQDRFSEKIGVPKNTLRRWERGDQTPSFEALNAILEAYPEINPAWLITGDGEELLSYIKKGKKNFKSGDLGINIIQALIENLAGLNKKESRNWASLTIVVWEMIEEVRETLPTVDEIKSILKAYHSLSIDFPEPPIPGGIDKFLNITYKIIAGHEEVNISNINNNDESMKES